MPKYQKVIEEIKSWLFEERFRPHDKLPTETQLMERFQVSRHTVRRAIGDLEAAQYLYRIQGAGMFVSEWKEKRNNQAPARTIAVLTTHISDYIFPRIISGIEKVLSEQSFSLLLSSTHNNPEMERKSLESLLAQPIEGMIIEPTKSSSPSPNIGIYNNIKKNNIPCLFINAVYAGLDVPVLAVDDVKGGCLVTEHLLSLGHERLLGIFKTDDQQGVNRMNGFISAFQRHPSLAGPGQFITFQTGEKKDVLPERIRAVLKQENRPTGVVCYNDQTALIVLSAAKELGLRVPEDLSVTGYDDSPLADMLNVSLTTVKHPQEQMGADAGKRILQIIKGEKIEAPSFYEPELLIRNSTKAYFPNTN